MEPANERMNSEANFKFRTIHAKDLGGITFSTQFNLLLGRFLHA